MRSTPTTDPPAPRSAPGAKRGTLGVLWVLALAAIAPFLPALGYHFVAWDDDGNFSENPDFGPLGLARARWAWKTFRLGVYQPLAWMFLEAQASLWGLDARGYHCVSVLLHAVNAIVLYRLIVALVNRGYPDQVRPGHRDVCTAAALATLLFVVHPLRVEVVGWASCQPYLPSILCAMLALLAYLRANPAQGPQRREWVYAAWVAFTASLLFKAETVTLPFVLLVLDVYPLRRLGPGRWLNPRVWAEKTPFVASALALAWTAALARMSTGAFQPVDSRGLVEAIGRACYAIVFYPWKTVWPSGLSIFYSPPGQGELPAWRYGPAALAVIVVSLAAFAGRRRWPGVLAAWAAYLVLISPHLGLIRSGPALAADRHSYLATIPFATLLAAGLARVIASERRNRGIVAGACLLAAALGMISWEQCRTWRSSEALFATALGRGGSHSPEVRASLAAALAANGRTTEAAKLCEEALRLDPANGEAHYNLGLIRSRQGRYAAAETHFAAAVAARPDDPDAHSRLALLLARRGQAAEAVAHLDHAFRLRPLPDTAFKMGVILDEQKRFDEAITCYRSALRLRPDHAPTHNNLGVVLLEQGHYREAEAQFLAALRLQPDYRQALNGLEIVRRRRAEAHPALPGR
jgi:tetratricopeptide (TPR) repeat protein